MEMHDWPPEEIWATRPKIRAIAIPVVFSVRNRADDRLCSLCGRPNRVTEYTKGLAEIK